MKDITSMTGIAAIFVRNFMEAFSEGERKLFECQAAGKAATADAGSEISTAYLSSLSRRLSVAEVISKRKHGKNWVVDVGNNTEAFLEFLKNNEGYGLLLEGSLQDLRDKSEVFTELHEHGAVRGGGDNLIPRAAFKKLMEQVKEGKLDIAFIKTGLTMGVKHEGETHKIECYVD